jgi:hypothetical protein
LPPLAANPGDRDAQPPVRKAAQKAFTGWE